MFLFGFHPLVQVKTLRASHVKEPLGVTCQSTETLFSQKLFKRCKTKMVQFSECDKVACQANWSSQTNQATSTSSWFRLWSKCGDQTKQSPIWLLTPSHLLDSTSAWYACIEQDSSAVQGQNWRNFGSGLLEVLPSVVITIQWVDTSNSAKTTSKGTWAWISSGRSGKGILIVCESHTVQEMEGSGSF